MRTIVARHLEPSRKTKRYRIRPLVRAAAFALICTLAGAQTPVEQMEKAIADRPDAIQPRVNLLQNLLNRGVPLPPEKVRETRRRHILWLIEHHPEAANFAEPALLLADRGRLADPAGSAEAVVLWKALAADPSSKPEVVANAAIYLRALDVRAALSILDAHPDSPVLSRARGMVDGAAVVGLSGIGQNAQFGSSATLRSSPEAKAARTEIDSSWNAYLVGKAGAVLISAGGQIEVPFDLTFGDDDALTLGERWLRRAIELDPSNGEWKPPLGQALQTKANRTIDPKEKVRLLLEAQALVPEGAKPGVLQNLLAAEFDSGDDASAGRDAQSLLASAPKNANAYNAAQTILGRIAAAKGDLKEAKSRLIASVTMPAGINNAVFQPNMTLAQDIYDSGDRDVVIQFLEASRAVWKFDRGRIDRMISFVKKAPSADLTQLANQFPGNEVIRRPAPAFTAQDLDGKTWTREQLAGKVVALEFGNAPLAEKVSKDFSARGAVLLQVQDADTKRRFEVLTDPTLVVVDPKGNVAAFRAGAATEAEWRTEFETGFGGGPNPVYLPAPKQAASGASAGGKVTLAWEQVDNAESYVVEWDSRDEKGWLFDREKTVRVIPTRETSTTLDLTGFTRIRWRVYSVPRFGQGGNPSPWREIEGTPVTKIYK
jgi:hypothetical protein